MVMKKADFIYASRTKGKIKMAGWLRFLFLNEKETCYLAGKVSPSCPLGCTIDLPTFPVNCTGEFLTEPVWLKVL